MGHPVHKVRIEEHPRNSILPVVSSLLWRLSRMRGFSSSSFTSTSLASPASNSGDSAAAAKASSSVGQFNRKKEWIDLFILFVMFSKHLSTLIDPIHDTDATASINPFKEHQIFLGNVKCNSIQVSFVFSIE